ncbi:MAG: hypothetical protein C4305_08635 [Thermoleophilia bacterium]
MGAVLLVVGAEDELIADVLAQAGEDDSVVVVDPCGARLLEVEKRLPDPRVWLLVGDAEVVPLPDRSVDRAFGLDSFPERERVCR